VRLAFVEVAAQPNMAVGQCEDRLGLGEHVQVERGLRHGPRLDAEFPVVDHIGARSSHDPEWADEAVDGFGPWPARYQAGRLANCMLLTVGHGTHPQQRFVELLHDAGVKALVDVRTAPGSRRNPPFRRAELARWLPEAGIAYRWEPALGGFRRLPHESPDTALRNESFRAYAAHMRTPPFATAIAVLANGARMQPTAVMCSESVWWRCHRRLIADHSVLLDDLPVQHLMPDGRLAGHRLTDGVRVSGNVLIYDGR
jgi:hypothetical protein